MRILNFGSLNYDDVYTVEHIAAPGETVSSTAFLRNLGGKGLNQSVALARAGADVFHAGNVGPDGEELIRACIMNHVDAHLIRTVAERSGSAIIQVSSDGQNSILLFPGANRENDMSYIEHVLSACSPGDLILLQNEINLIDFVIDRAYELGLTIALNPSPFDAHILSCNLDKVTFFLLNEVEGAQLTGRKEPEEILSEILCRWPRARIVLTLGACGVLYRDSVQSHAHSAYAVKVEDTTAAGDTFTGYFLASAAKGLPIQAALELASVASSLTVSHKGATCSIPTREQVLAAQSQMLCGALQ